jgi:hypothetical protein
MEPPAAAIGPPMVLPAAVMVPPTGLPPVPQIELPPVVNPIFLPLPVVNIPQMVPPPMINQINFPAGLAVIPPVPKTLKAYDINPVDDIAEEKLNEGMPDYEFFPKEGDSVLCREKGVRELNRRYNKRKVALEYEAELAAEAKQLRRLLGGVDEGPSNTVTVPKKIQYHFSDQDGKEYISLVKEVSKTCFKKSMAFIRMMNDTRLLELCLDDLHIVLDVDHVREWFFSKSNISVSALPQHWSSLELWNTVIHFNVMCPEKFSSLLLFNASYENLRKFSIVDFLKCTSSLTNIDMLKITLDNMQTVYECIFGSEYKNLCEVPKSFLQSNVSILEIRDFKFVVDVFNKAFVNFQVDMRSRNVEVPNTKPLNNASRVSECFVQWFTFTPDMFTLEKEAVFKLRPRFTVDSLGENLAKKERKVPSTATTSIKVLPKVKVAGRPNVPLLVRKPCIRHLAEILGVQKLGSENPVSCRLGANCAYEHHSLPLGKSLRKELMDFVTSSNMPLLKLPLDKGLLLQKI